MLSVIVDDTRDPAHNLALDEALARTCGHPDPGATLTLRPVLRVWQSAPSVIVGRFQNVAEAVDLAACARDGVRVVRRPTGGGAVFTDAGSINFTLVCRAGDPQGHVHGPGDGPARRPDPRPGPRPDLDVLVATAVEGFGLPAAALRDGAIQTAWLHTRHAALAHTTVHVTPVGAAGRGYVAPSGRAEQRTLAGHGLGLTLDAVRAAVLGAVVDRYGIACARPLNALERLCRDHLLATRYNEVTWHLMGTPSPRVKMRFIVS